MNRKRLTIYAISLAIKNIIMNSKMNSMYGGFRLRSYAVRSIRRL